MTDINPHPVSDFDAAVRLLSSGTNVAIYNDLGLPSIYVRRDKGLISDVIEGGSNTTHYAFIVNGIEIPAFYMGKYLATVYKGRALSLPLQDPAALTVTPENIGNADSNKVTFDNAKIWCEANGAGFHLPTIAEYAWIALLSKKNGTMPRGNNYNGLDRNAKHEGGIITTKPTTYRTLTGSGPATWNDNWKPDGICDLNGNVNEWQGGYRTVDGELQIFADNDAAMQYKQNPESTRWRAILQDGTLVEPGTADTLKWDFDNSGSPDDYWIRLNTKVETPIRNEEHIGFINFEHLEAVSGVNIPERLKSLALMPAGVSSYKDATHGQDCMYADNRGERMTVRGGDHYSVNGAGVFSANMAEYRWSAYDRTGFRPAFIPGI